MSYTPSLWAKPKLYELNLITWELSFDFQIWLVCRSCTFLVSYEQINTVNTLTHNQKNNPKIFLKNKMQIYLPTFWLYTLFLN